MKTGYATVARNIIKNIIDPDKYDIAQLGLADIPVYPDLPITHYSPVKNHNKCCGKGPCIEVGTVGKLPQYIACDPFVEPLSNQNVCIKGENEPGDAYAYSSSFFAINHFQPDIVIPINDIWGLFNIVHLRSRPNFKFYPYLAIDSDCIFPSLNPPVANAGLPKIDIFKTVGGSDKVIVFTDWARDVINKTTQIVNNGYFNNIDVIPHGVDTSVWKPLPNKKELRTKYFSFQGASENTFLIGFVSRNQPRKRIDALFQVLRILKDKYETKQRPIKCYFHCCLEDQLGWDLAWMAKYYGVDSMCIFDKNLKPGIGPEDWQLNEIVNCFDAHCVLSNSEGWGLTLLESAAAGIPTVTTKYSAMADWGKDTLLFAKVSAYEHEPKTGFIKALVDIEHAAKQLSLLYQSPKMCEEYSRKGIKLGKDLDWKEVTKKWIALFDSTDTSKFEPNRYFGTRIDHNNLDIPDLPEDPINTPFKLTEL